MLKGEQLGAAIDAARIKKKLSKKALADRFNVKPPSIQGWIATGRIDKTKMIQMIAFFSDVVPPSHWGLADGTVLIADEAHRSTPGEQSTIELPGSEATIALTATPAADERSGHSPSSDDYALIPQYTAKGSSGNGYLNDHVEIKGGLAFKRDWLCRMGLKPDNLRVAYNHGDSNWPTLTDGEVVLLDVAAIEPANGKMFALLDPDGEMIFKRLIRDIKGGWLIRSDNDNKTLYPDMPISDEGIRGVDIVGRIVWRGGAM